VGAAQIIRYFAEFYAKTLLVFPPNLAVLLEAEYFDRLAVLLDTFFDLVEDRVGLGRNRNIINCHGSVIILYFGGSFYVVFTVVL